jgi:hypothetical protein
MYFTLDGVSVHDTIKAYLKAATSYGFYIIRSNTKVRAIRLD